MTPREAYDKGWQASSRTRTYDLDAAEGRFIARYGRTLSDHFVCGWTDHASGYDKYDSLKES